jgi:flagellar biogenesis protein FliO
LTKRTSGAVKIETAVPLGERRSLVIVAVEGRRLLIGLTPASVSLVTNLEPHAPGFGQALEQASQQETASVT